MKNPIIHSSYKTASSRNPGVVQSENSLLAFPLQSIHRDSPRLDIQCLFEGKWNIFWDSKLCGSDSFDHRIRAEVKTQKVLTGGFRMDEKYYLYGLKKKNTVICFVTYGD